MIASWERVNHARSSILEIGILMLMKVKIWVSGYIQSKE